MQSSSSRLTRPAVVAALATLSCLLWGSAIPFINLGYRHFAIDSGDTPSLILFAGCRFALAGLLTILISSLQRRRLLVPQGPSGWGCAARLAAVQTIGQYVFFYIGVAHTPSMNASLIQGLGPFVSILVAAWVFRSEKMTAVKWLGGLLGIVGVLLVNWKPGGSVSFSLTGEGFLLISMITSACSSGMIKNYGQRNDPVTLSGWQFLMGGTLMALAGLLMGGRLQPDGMAAAGILIYLAFLSAIAYSVWALLLKVNPVSRIASYILLQPVFGTALALLLFGQETTLPLWRYLLALLFICGGILLEERSSGRET